jgi:hypothetical protein
MGLVGEVELEQLGLRQAARHATLGAVDQSLGGREHLQHQRGSVWGGGDDAGAVGAEGDTPDRVRVPFRTAKASPSARLPDDGVRRFRWRV